MSRAVEATPETESLVRTLVADVIGRPVHTADRMAYGHGSVTYRAEAGEDGGGPGGVVVIVRTDADPDVYAGTLANLAVLRGLGLPVPSVLHADLTCSRYPFAYLVTDSFPGRDLGFELADMTAAQMSRLAEQVVGFERQVSTLPHGYGYGFMPIGAADGHGRWIDAVRADRRSVLETADGGVGGDVGGGVGGAVGGIDREFTDLIADLRRAFDRSSARLDAIEPICFLDDLTTKNVIVHEGVLRGVVDFDVVCYGDPMYWLALTQVAVLSDVRSAGQFYIDELTRLWAPSACERMNLALYSALHAAEFLRWPDDDRTDSAAARRDRLTRSARSWLAAAV